MASLSFGTSLFYLGISKNFIGNYSLSDSSLYMPFFPYLTSLTIQGLSMHVTIFGNVLPMLNMSCSTLAVHIFLARLEFLVVVLVSSMSSRLLCSHRW